MSRLIVFDFQSDSVGEFHGMASRGWQIAGVERTNGGGSMTITVPKSDAIREYMRLGNMLYVEHESLPAYAGMIDLPWKADPPAKITVYNAEYLLTLRYPDAPVVLTGSVAQIVSQIITMVNAQEDLFLRPGEMSQAQSVIIDYTMDQRNFWDHLNTLCMAVGMEMIFRPVRNQGDRKLYILVDIGFALGYYTDALLRDGDGGNMIVQSAELGGEIINRVLGTGSQSNTSNRITTSPIVDVISRDNYRLRGKVVQFRDVTQPETLTAMSSAYLQSVRRPLLKMKILVKDIDNGRTFSLLRLGNSYKIHASKVLLPRGKQGWLGIGRTLAMAYNEGDNTVGMSVEGYLD